MTRKEKINRILELLNNPEKGLLPEHIAFLTKWSDSFDPSQTSVRIILHTPDDVKQFESEQAELLSPIPDSIMMFIIRIINSKSRKNENQ